MNIPHHVGVKIVMITAIGNDTLYHVRAQWQCVPYLIAVKYCHVELNHAEVHLF